ncbi:FAD binding domain-containing protein [Desulfobacter latus]|uniref:FAD binding domain-containing protein n=1 Tax=Desulfobacter latus TaxID=2292 RepID=A0A850SY73_9BACT|nr:FAD binding domain-containing protein [Desulfobacter latus]NWH06254.1 FAD binding domain-containing protein [Desulfobacter latus]
MKKRCGFILNNKEMELSLLQGRSVLDLLRKDLGLYGTKEGCREGECGACTVILGRTPLVTYRSMPACLMPAGQLNNTHLVTIKGLQGERPNRLQQAFINQGATQCGFCTPGFILSLTGYLLEGRTVTVQGAIDALGGNLCRCTGYGAIRRAVEETVEPLLGKVPSLQGLIELDLLPDYFATIPQRLENLRRKPQSDSPDVTLERVEKNCPLIAGGTDLYVQRGDALNKSDPRFLIPEAEPIRVEEGMIEILASATMEQLRQDPHFIDQFPGWREKLLVIASHILRHRATLGGNLVNASPIADCAVLLLALDAQIQLVSSKDSRRRFPLRAFFLGYKELDLKCDELVEFLLVTKRDEAQLWNYAKVSKRERLDIAGCNSAAVFTVNKGAFASVGLALGGVAPIPFTARRTMKWLRGKPLSKQTFLGSMEVLQEEISPIDDVRGSAEYKRRLASALMADHYLHCFSDICSYDDFVKGGAL